MNVKRARNIVVVSVCIFIGIILFLGWISSKKVRDAVTDNINQQQLILARNSAKQIKHDIESLKNQISIMSTSPYIFKDTKVLSDVMKITFLEIKGKGGVQIKYIDGVKQLTFIADDKGMEIKKATSKDIDYLKLKIQNGEDGILLSDILVEKVDGFNRPLFYISHPVKNPFTGFEGGSAKYSGILVFVIDAYILTSKATKDIVVGKTGHAFVIDQKNIFLYHYEADFIGKDSTSVRREKNPSIPFEKIDIIQANHMIKGEEGTDLYISGWHRGELGEIKKLIAYTPIQLNDFERHIWSVAIIVPVSEVEDTIHSIQVSQFGLQLMLILSVILVGLHSFFMLITWSDSLQREVERKTFEFKLSEEKYKSLVENADDIIFTIDSSGKFLSINQYGQLFFNKEKEDIIDHSIFDLIPEPYADEFMTKLVELVTHYENIKFTHFLKIGESGYWLNTNLRKLCHEGEKICTVLGISRDITVAKKKEIEEQMYHTEKLASMGTLAAGVAHEINNPLAIIFGFSDLLLEQTSPDSSEYTMLKTIQKHALNAKKVVEGLLSFARYSDQKEETCDINKNIEVVLSVVKNTLALNNIRINKELQSDLPPVQGDPGKFQQVFLNLINNSIHAMKDGGELRIQTNILDKENIEVRFGDTGHGINLEFRNKIFDPLFTTKKVGEGTGLGLSVCYGIITQHGGKITFESKTKDESSTPGTTFIITLPVAKHE